MDRVLDYLNSHRGDLAAIGISSFGPIALNRNAKNYGYITSTPKPGWRNVNLVGPIRNAFPDIPITFDTDVNSAALAEKIWGSARGLSSFVYVCVGTGLGGGGFIGETQIHGLLHPEMGHIRIPHDWHKDPFAGSCPFHGDCWEGLASGTAIERRWGVKAELLPDNHEAWALEAHYLALGIANIACLISPQRIILGGSVVTRGGLLQMIRLLTAKYLNKYFRASEFTVSGIRKYIVHSSLGGRAGILGALALARQQIESSPP